jgi:hypothetical protein
MSEAIAQALRMSETEQRDRMRLMRDVVRSRNVYRWAGQMTLDASQLRKRQKIMIMTSQNRRDGRPGSVGEIAPGSMIGLFGTRLRKVRRKAQRRMWDNLCLRNDLGYFIQSTLRRAHHELILQSRLSGQCGAPRQPCLSCADAADRNIRKRRLPTVKLNLRLMSSAVE